VSRETALTIELPSGAVTAIASEGDRPAVATFIYAPGAGSNVHDPFGTFLCRELAARGMRAVRFQFPYQEAGRRSPDRAAALEETWRCAVEQLAGPVTVAGGRSMGGRIASQVVAGGAVVAGLALFAYPLHPPGKPERARSEHLPAIGVPVLFCSGTNDAFASPEELRAAAALVPQGSVHLLEGADHGFSAAKSSGRTREEVWTEALAALGGWLAAEGIARLSASRS
jgi:predicted alpha/beta-hydrolase family hydrolase